MSSKQRASYVAMGFLSGMAAGSLMWSRMQRNCRRNLFSRNPLFRVAALGYLRARPTINTAQLLREYIAWEPRPILRQRGARMLKQLESTL